MSVTAKDLAKELRLSEAAVSMALNGKPGVSTATRKRVVETAKRMGYDFSRVGEPSLSSPVQGTITFIIYRRHGAIVSDTPFFSQLSEGIDSACRKLGYHLNICYLYENENTEKRLKEIVAAGCSGILLLGTEMSEKEFAPFSHPEVPLVLLDCYFENAPVDCVLINNVQGAYLATDYLIRARRSQPGYLRSSYPIQNFEERADGFYKAIRAAGMSPSRSIVHRLSPSVEGACGDMTDLLRQGESIADCYFADNDLIAAGAVRALKEHGYLIPKEVAVIGFDDLPLCGYMDPPLSTVRVPKQYMGQMAAKRLAELIDDPSSSPVKLEIRTSLVKRKSV